jgi:ribosome biogenesis GTPase
MRAIALSDAAIGIGAVFADIETLAEDCRFRDCAHETEPGCAVQAAIAAGTLKADRVARYTKLSREDAMNSEAVHQSRAREKGLHKMYRSTQSSGRKKKGH